MHILLDSPVEELLQFPSSDQIKNYKIQQFDQFKIGILYSSIFTQFGKSEDLIFKTGLA